MAFEINRRIEWIDIAKGFSIFLVVIGHTGLSGDVANWLGSFRMPLFFFVSGILFSHKKYSTFTSFFEKRMRTLVKPYIIFSIINYFWSMLINYKLIQLHFSELYSGWTGLALWFIPVLFLTEIWFYFIIKHMRSLFCIVFTLILLSVIGYFFYRGNIHYPFKIEVVFTSILFYGMGNISGKYVLLLFEMLKPAKLYIFSLLLLSSSLLISLINKPRLDLASNIIGNYFPSYLGSLLGLLFIFFLSAIISKLNGSLWIKLKNSISYLGKNSYVILAFHQIVLMNLKMIFDKFYLPNYLNSGFRHILLWITLIGLIYFVNNYCPRVLGKIVK